MVQLGNEGKINYHQVANEGKICKTDSVTCSIRYSFQTDDNNFSVRAGCTFTSPSIRSRYAHISAFADRENKQLVKESIIIMNENCIA